MCTNLPRRYEEEPEESNELNSDTFKTCSGAMAFVAGIILFAPISGYLTDEVARAILHVGTGVVFALIAITLAILYNGSLREENAQCT